MAGLGAAAWPAETPWPLRAVSAIALGWIAWRWVQPWRLVQQQLDAVLEHSPVGIAFGRNSRFELVGAHLANMLGSTAQQLQGQPTRVMYASEHDRADLVARAHAMFEASGACDDEVRLADAAGRVFWGRLRGCAVRPGCIDAGTIWIIEDISHSRAHQQQLAWAAEHDALTGLVNRRAFEARIQRLHDEGRHYCVLFIDLDHFKQVNDRAGHAAGDRLLVDIGKHFTASVRDSDTVARLGGDEFAVLMPGCPPDRARTVAKSMVIRVGAWRLEDSDLQLQVGASKGLVHQQGSWVDVTLVMKAADEACYAAKRNGRNGVLQAPTPGGQAGQACCAPPGLA